MASFFNMKGTTQNEFQIGVKGPKISRTSFVNKDMLSLENLKLIKIFLNDDGKSYIDQNNYTGTSALAKQLENNISITFSGIQIDDKSVTELNGSTDSKNFNIKITEIPSSLLTGDIAWDRINSLVSGTGAEAKLSRSDHNHDDIYLKKILLKSKERTGDGKNTPYTGSDISLSQIDINPLSSGDTAIELDLKIANDSISSDHLKAKSITEDKLALGIIASKNLITPKKGETGDKSGDYSGKIWIVKSAKDVTDSIANVSINDILVKNEQEKFTSTVKNAANAQTASAIDKPIKLWGQESDINSTGKLYSAIFKGNISDTGSILPGTTGSSDLGSESLKYKNLYLSNKIDSLNGNITNLTVNSLSITDKTTTIDATVQNAKEAVSLTKPLKLWGKTTTFITTDPAYSSIVEGDLIDVGTIKPKTNKQPDIGTKDLQFNNVYAINFMGNASTATSAGKLSKAFLKVKKDGTTTDYDGSTACTIDLDSLMKSVLTYKETILFKKNESKTHRMPLNAESGDVYAISIDKDTGKCYIEVPDLSVDTDSYKSIPIESGDMVICRGNDSIKKNKLVWDVIQNNIDLDSFEQKYVTLDTKQDNISGQKTFTGQTSFTYLKYNNNELSNLLISSGNSNNATSATEAYITLKNTAGTDICSIDLPKVKSAITADKINYDLKFKVDSTEKFAFGKTNTTDKSININNTYLSASYASNELEISHKEIHTATDNSTSDLAIGSSLLWNNSSASESGSKSFNIPKITYDKAGHITGVSQLEYTMPDKPENTWRPVKVQKKSTDNTQTAIPNDSTLILKPGNDNIQLNAYSSNGIVSISATDTTYSANIDTGVNIATGNKIELELANKKNRFSLSPSAAKSASTTLANAAAMRLYPILLSNDKKLSVYVPWVETKIYSANTSTANTEFAEFLTK